MPNGASGFSRALSAARRLPVVFCIDRAGITGDKGASHHGVYDLALLSKVPGMRVLAPSSAQEPRHFEFA